ncbi:prepilin-type N-terminal cleavage/methylation domain-containing protein [Actinotalea solisilvae]|uniref:prepilin-type N-terminal cleavage/methylation domain-containing protein n=1 Tax=Actinotalea solisilvae TaxID=2072922 RepID=UPI0018F18071|nr:prepilin-type N-terminal cleavage/methylation domain-containing protein [Actinotalea solisilvae]
MRERLRRARRSGEAEAGMTLIEMLISMGVFSLAIALAFGAVITVVRSTNEARDSAAAVTEMRQALAQIDRQIRSGNVLFSPSDEPTYVGTCVDMGSQSGTCMRIFTQSNGTRQCVQWQMLEDAGSDPKTFTLRTRSWSTDWNTGGTSQGWSVVARDLWVDTTTPYSSANAPFVLQGASTPYKDRMLLVRLYSARTASTGEHLQVTSSLTGRNTTYGYDSSQCDNPPPP